MKCLLTRVHQTTWINWFDLLHYRQNISKHGVENKQCCMLKYMALRCLNFERFLIKSINVIMLKRIIYVKPLPVTYPVACLIYRRFDFD